MHFHSHIKSHGKDLVMDGVKEDTRFGGALGLHGDHAPRSRSFGGGRVVAGMLLLAVVAGWAATALAQNNFPEEPREPRRLPFELGPVMDEKAVPDQNVVEVRVEGNTTIPDEAILKLVKTRVGRAPAPKQIKDDVSALYGTKWFFSVAPRYRQTDNGIVVIFEVVERPVLKSVTFHGNEAIKTKKLDELIGLRPGGAYDVSINREAARRIEDHYHEKGHVFATVTLAKGDSKDDREVVFEIHEGPKVKVNGVRFVGNNFASDALLRTKLETSIRKLWLFGGKFDPATIPGDVEALTEYYHALGFFDVKVNPPKQLFSKDKSRLVLEYQIEEGLRYKVRNVEIAGNQVLSTDALRNGMEVKAGDYFTLRKLNKDIQKVIDQYGDLGRIFAKIDASPRFLETPGMVDIVYNLNEDQPIRIRRINVHIHGDNPHTQESVVLNRIGIYPGDLASQRAIKRGEGRLRGQIFANGQGGTRAPRIEVVRSVEPPQGAAETIVRAQGVNDTAQQLDRVFNSSWQTDPLDNRMLGLPPHMADVNVDVDETQTGRLMFGVGVNSNAGLLGNIVLEENNFDISRPPRSWQDIVNGTAWRGAGQQFRIEAVPGNQLSRYVVSFTDPYFLDQDISFGISGFYFTRFYQDWDETRMGGRLSLGKIFTQTITGSVSVRLEDVEVRNPSNAGVPLLAESLGHNFLSTVRVGLAHDTRDSPFLPGAGHYVEASYEQAFGEFDYPRAELEGRQYFTTWERPDGSGRHIFTLAGNLAWTGSDTPIFERLYGGGFQSFRGFRFRGVSPRDQGVRIGGQWMSTGTAEYMIPLTADGMISAVAFSDFGTVDTNVSFGDFRVTAGGGLRLTVPAMGPVPIALDFAWPIAKQGEDDLQVFSFYVGLSR
jgi:outer membrane protein insertion porin family